MDFVKADLQWMVQRILYDEATVVRELTRRKNADNTSESAVTETALRTASLRLTELDKLIAKAYEEMVAGEIPREALLLQLVDKVIVGQKTDVDGVSHQQITLVYNFVGAVD